MKRKTRSAEVADPCKTRSAEVADPLAALASAYTGVDGYSTAREEKRRQRTEGVFLDGIQYGEVDAAAFASALQWVSPRIGEHFYDLGSGTGKAVLTAAVTHPFGRVTGIEILEPLHLLAKRALARLAPEALQAAAVRLVHGDALAHDWCISHGPIATAEGVQLTLRLPTRRAADAGLVFCTLTCFTDEMVATLARDCVRLPHGARLLVTSRELQCEPECMRLIRREKLPYGKGSLLFLAYERI